MAAASGEDALYNRGRDILGLEDNVIECWVIDERANEGSADPGGIHEAAGCQRAGLLPSRERDVDLRGSYIGCIVSVLQLGCKTLMEGHGASFRAVIVDDGRHCHVGCHACDGHYVAFVLLDHGGQEFPHRQEVGERVDLKGPADRVLGFVENGHGVANRSIVDQDRWGAMGFANLSTDSCEVCGRRDIGLVEVDAG